LFSDPHNTRKYTVWAEQRIICIQFVPRSKHSVSVTQTSQLMLYREIIALCSQIHTTRKYTVWAEQRIICIQFVPRSKHSVSVIQTSQLMLYREITAVCSQIHTTYVNTLCGQNRELYIFSPYRAVNTLRVGYRNQSINAV